VLFHDFGRLYEIRARLDRDPESLRYGRGFGLPPWWPELSWRSWPSERELALDVFAAQYESPGWVDLVGIGKVIEQIRLFGEKLIDLRATRRREELENQDLAVDIQAKKIENARNFLRLTGEARALGWSDDEIRYLMLEIDSAQERLAGLIERGQVTGVESRPV
jgi:hypothetical protein